ncbi:MULTISPECIES: response regulator [Methylomonas]|uniref:response regulator n=1 Tax=Methylomonas TaxID=416 RepID=UPI001232CAF5|nr:response regulator [Methylomonas rhizoryzae]
MNRPCSPRISIVNKLAKALRLMAILTLFVATVSLSVREFNDLHQELNTKLTLTADMIGQNCSYPIVFEDKKTAQEVLNALAHDPDIISGVIRSANGEIFASYAKATSNWHILWPKALQKNHTTRRPILDANNREIGDIVLVADLKQPYHALIRNAALNAAIVFAALSIAAVFVLRLQRSLLTPIVHLANIARQIERDHDYSKRSDYAGNDEISDLSEAFNSMLSQIQANEAYLENQVLLRTRELQIAKQEAEQANQTKGEFLANMSHEIRTPMNAIVGLVELCLNSEISDKLRTYLERVEAASHSLMDIIDDILDFSKMEAGKMKLESIPFLLEDVLEQVFATMNQLAAQKGLKLSCPASGTVHAVIGDPQRLRQILINLIGNAIKFTEYGEVGISVVELNRTSQHISLQFCVSDTGIGISEAQQQRLFQAFSQGDSSVTRTHGGTGLGLVISKQLVEQMGGTIRVVSQKQVGSKFIFSVKLGVADFASVLYARQQNGSPMASKHSHQLRGRKVLLVEDNEINRIVAVELLEKVLIQVDVAENGAIALEKLAQHRYDCILMDVQMPEIDGYMATKRLKEMDACKNVPVIAMTANAMQEDKLKCLEAGMVDYICKPILPKTLYAVLEKWLAPEREQE